MYLLWYPLTVLSIKIHCATTRQWTRCTFSWSFTLIGPKAINFHKKELISLQGWHRFVLVEVSSVAKDKYINKWALNSLLLLLIWHQWQDGVSFLASLIWSDIHFLYMTLEMFLYRLLVWLAPVYASGIVQRREMYFPHVRTYSLRPSVCGV